MRITFATTSAMGLVLAIAAVSVPVVPAEAQTRAERRAFNIPAQDLANALEAFGRQSGKDVVFDAARLAGKRSRAVKGALDATTALQRLTEGTGVTVRAVGASGFVIEAIQSTAAQPTEESASADIVVTGSHIRGAEPTSPVVRVTAKDIKDAGQTTLGEVIRSLPQNFNGGQNPGVQGGNGSNDFDVTGGSALNLRGLGQDATLTLINGHRMPQGGAAASVNIAAIPVDAVERIEIVADGASALYGSDAVGGVANVILKKDFTGLATSARFGASTDGGNAQQQYSAVGGTTWNGGGVIATYDYAENTAIRAGQRSYAAPMDPTTSIYPEQKRHNALVSLNQNISSNIKLSLDAIYSHTDTNSQISYSDTKDGYLSYGIDQEFISNIYSIAPRIDIAVGDWNFAISGVLGKDNTRINSRNYTPGLDSNVDEGIYYNGYQSAEFTADGGLLHLPAGSARLAIGGGYRNNSMNYHSYSIYGNEEFSASQSAYYGFSELSVPIVSPAMGIPGIRRIILSGAIRYEDYNGIGHETTPKIGLIYEVSEGITFKASWGNSFKIPTFYQQYRPQRALLIRVRNYGSTFPTGSTFISTDGGNSDLAPERAQTWTAGFAINPSSLKNFTFEASYFNIRYQDRINLAFTSSAGILTNPVYIDAGIVTRNPTATQIANVIARAAIGLENFAGAPYNPANVIAILEGRPVNISSQRIQGIDAYVQYRFDLGSAGTLTTVANLAYIDSSQVLIGGGSSADLAGTMYNPPHFKGRVGATLASGNAGISVFANYIGSVQDVRYTPSVKIGSMTTFDVTAHVETSSSSPLFKGLTFSASVFNLLNAKPAPRVTSAVYERPYDSTNYSSVGRAVSLSVSKKW